MVGVDLIDVELVILSKRFWELFWLIFRGEAFAHILRLLEVAPNFYLPADLFWVGFLQHYLVFYDVRFHVKVEPAELILGMVERWNVVLRNILRDLMLTDFIWLIRCLGLLLLLVISLLSLLRSGKFHAFLRLVLWGGELQHTMELRIRAVDRMVVHRLQVAIVDWRRVDVRVSFLPEVFLLLLLLVVEHFHVLEDVVVLGVFGRVVCELIRVVLVVRLRL